MTLHTAARAALCAWQPPDDDQAELRDEYIRYLDTHPDGVRRTSRPGHLTGSLIILNDVRAGSQAHEAPDQVLLVLHGKIDAWVQPGGHCEAEDRSLAETALREGREETGLVALELLSPHPVRLSRHAAPCGARTHYDVQYAAVAAPGANPVVSAESRDVRWFPVDRLPDRLAEGVAENVAAAVRRRSGATGARTPGGRAGSRWSSPAATP